MGKGGAPGDGRLSLTVFPWGAVSEASTPLSAPTSSAKGDAPAHAVWCESFGAHHMAGTVSEWCRNVDGPGYAAPAAKDAAYVFGQTAAYPRSTQLLRGLPLRNRGGGVKEISRSSRGLRSGLQPVDDGLESFGAGTSTSASREFRARV